MVDIAAITIGGGCGVGDRCHCLSVGGGSVGKRGGYLCYRGGGVGDRCHCLSVGGGGVGQGGSYFCYRGGGVGHRCNCLSVGGGGVSHGGSYLSDGSCKSLLVHDGVESVVGISGVLDGTTSAVRLHQAVAALDDVSVTGFVLALRVAGQSVLDVVSVAVLGVRVVVGVDGYGGGDLSDGGGGIGEGSGDLCDGRGSVGHGSVS